MNSRDGSVDISWMSSSFYMDGNCVHCWQIAVAYSVIETNFSYQRRKSIVRH